MLETITYHPALEEALRDLQDVIDMRPWLKSENLNGKISDPEIQDALLALELAWVPSVLNRGYDPVRLQILVEHYTDYIVTNVRQ